MPAFAVTHVLGLRPSRSLCRSPRRPPAYAAVQSPHFARAALSSDAEVQNTTNTNTAAVPPIDPASDIPAGDPSPSEVFGALPASSQNRVRAVQLQVEFWFSASNLRRDWYLRRQMDAEGWIDPAVFLLFNRIKHLKATLEDVILACTLSDDLEASKPSEFSFGDSATQTRVRRSSSLPDFREWDESEVARSFLVKGIPADSTVESIQSIFEPLALPTFVRIYRSKEYPETPRALVCFSDVETANHVFSSFGKDAPPEAKGAVMRRRMVQPNSPPEEAIAGVIKDQVKSGALVFQLVGIPKEYMWRALFRDLSDVFKERTGQSLRYLMYDSGDEECYVTVTDDATTRDTLNDFKVSGIDLGAVVVKVRVLETDEERTKYWRLAKEHQETRKARQAERQAESDASPSSSSTHPVGVIIKIDGLSEMVRWRDLKKDITEFGVIVFLSSTKTDEGCSWYVRYGSSEEAVAAARALTEEAREVCGFAVNSYVLEGEEEEEYWRRAEEIRQRKRRGEF